MKQALALLVVAFALSAPEALAQYQNRGIGLNVGYLQIIHDVEVDGGLPIGLHASAYTDNSVELTAHTQFMLGQITGSVVPVLGFNLQFGARYLFLTDALRPYAGLHVTYMHFFAADRQLLVGGAGPHVGVDYFFNDAWSLGVRGQFNGLLDFHSIAGFRGGWSAGAAIEVTTWY